VTGYTVLNVVIIAVREARFVIYEKGTESFMFHYFRHASDDSEPLRNKTVPFYCDSPALKSDVWVVPGLLQSRCSPSRSRGPFINP
jgi:hypothetical protein